ncbi:dihydroneopterin aldolase [Ornithinibacillus halotolerans]|uniref:7,8-dihydroneopterin aldolase n=1 Tax=Ornithinibacillus halotolerans TaxID=1274357 RepID=A0A916RWJ8_9BACI|nr:dihydroneopterin aldolase [Ornithinibacillus halotolerans]GGA71062.1 7,8-dihydroneopterin aldolase [Ornithinibacillus halotolerans]
MDKIILTNMRFYGFHGLLPEEKKLGQRFNVDLELYLDTSKAGNSDNMHYSIDYSKVYQKVKAVVEGKSKNLIEAVAESVAANLLASFTLLEACRVKVIKPDPPIPGHYESVAVEIFREKSHE